MTEADATDPPPRTFRDFADDHDVLELIMQSMTDRDIAALRLAWGVPLGFYMPLPEWFVLLCQHKRSDIAAIIAAAVSRSPAVETRVYHHLAVERGLAGRPLNNLFTSVRLNTGYPDKVSDGQIAQLPGHFRLNAEGVMKGINLREKAWNAGITGEWLAEHYRAFLPHDEDSIPDISPDIDDEALADAIALRDAHVAAAADRLVSWKAFFFNLCVCLIQYKCFDAVRELKRRFASYLQPVERAMLYADMLCVVISQHRGEGSADFMRQVARAMQSCFQLDSDTDTFLAALDHMFHWNIKHAYFTGSDDQRVNELVSVESAETDKPIYQGARTPKDVHKVLRLWFRTLRVLVRAWPAPSEGIPHLSFASIDASRREIARFAFCHGDDKAYQLLGMSFQKPLTELEVLPRPITALTAPLWDETTKSVSALFTMLSRHPYVSNWPPATLSVIEMHGHHAAPQLEALFEIIFSYENRFRRTQYCWAILLACCKSHDTAFVRRALAAVEPTLSRSLGAQSAQRPSFRTIQSIVGSGNLDVLSFGTQALAISANSLQQVLHMPTLGRSVEMLARGPDADTILAHALLHHTPVDYHPPELRYPYNIEPLRASIPALSISWESIDDEVMSVGVQKLPSVFKMARDLHFWITGADMVKSWRTMEWLVVHVNMPPISYTRDGEIQGVDALAIASHLHSASERAALHRLARNGRLRGWGRALTARLNEHGLLDVAKMIERSMINP
ncbi:hypothetical protein EMVG_00249 [Emiliania huxleyi virus PS401]|nr:hypothetical protein EMVG_00249 [Emiliania huxleyi virus PS401]